MEVGERQRVQGIRFKAKGGRQKVEGSRGFKAEGVRCTAEIGINYYNSRAPHPYLVFNLSNSFVANAG